MKRGNPKHSNQFLKTCERDKYGCTVTARVDGIEISLARGGFVLEALREILAVMEQAGEVEVLSISTPGTIYGDLIGTRADLNSGVTATADRVSHGTTLMPELVFLSRIGKAHLWAG